MDGRFIYNKFEEFFNNDDRFVEVKKKNLIDIVFYN